MRPFPALTQMLMIPGLIGCEATEGLGNDVKLLAESSEKKASDLDD